MDNQAIVYVSGDATRPIGDDPQIIVHICNDIGAWGRGFVVALSQRWSAPEDEYLRWHREREHNDFGLGAVQFVTVEPGLSVANLIGQRGILPTPEGPPVRYDAIDAGLRAVANHAQQQVASVHMPRIGCGLAGGAWAQIEPIIERTLVTRGVPVTVYDLP